MKTVSTFCKTSFIIGISFIFINFITNKAYAQATENYSFEATTPLVASNDIPHDVPTFSFDKKEQKHLFNKIMLATSSILANPTVCYSVSDGTDNLYSINRANGTPLVSIGGTAANLEAVVMSLDANTLYGADNNTWGTINTTTGAFTSIGTFGTGSGADGNVTFSDADGLAIDARTGKFYGAHRQTGGTSNDVLFEINPVTGAFVPDAFGTGIDYVVIATSSLGTVGGGPVLYDIDDIAVDPTDGQMYGIANQGGVDDRIVRIDKFTGAVTDVGRVRDSGGNINDVEGLAFFNDGTFYMTTGAGTNAEFHRIDPATGFCTLLGTFTEGGDYEGTGCLTGGSNIISGTVYEDLNENATLDGGENGVANVTVNLYEDLNNNGQVDVGDELIQTAVTPVAGTYSFEVAIEGNFVTNIIAPFGTLTTDNIEEADFIGYQNTDPSNDFGLTCIATAGQVEMAGFVFEDLNSDTIKASGETGAANINVRIYQDIDQDGVIDQPGDTDLGTVATNASGAWSYTATPAYTNAGTVDVRIDRSSDDADEDGGSVTLDDSKPSIGETGRYVGLKFRGITIPQGATINSAYMEFTSDSNQDKAPSSVLIYAHDGNNPSTYSTGDNNISSRPPTTANEPWAIGAWTQDATTNAQSPDISHIVQEIVDRTGWVNGNGINIILQGTGSEKREIQTFDNNAATAPRLVVNYTEIINDSISYIATVEENTLPNGGVMTTDNIETATFTGLGQKDCNNNFSYVTDADLSLTKTVNLASQHIDSTFIFTIVVTNNGPAAATGITVNDQLPTGLTHISDNSGGQYNTISGVWTIGSLASGASATLNITVSATEGGVYNNSAEVATSDFNDPDSTPNNNIESEDDQDEACISIPILFCAGDSYTLTAPTGLNNYQWYRDGQVLTGETAQTYTFTNVQGVSDTISFTANDSSTNCPYVEDCPAIFLDDTPDVNLNTPATTCTGEADQNFSATPVPADGATGVYSTTAPAGLIDNGDGTAVLDASVAGAGTWDVTYTYTTANGCVVAQTVSVGIEQSLSVNVASNSPICTWETITLFENGGDATAWNWTGPNGFNSTEQNPVLTNANSLNAGTYTVVVSNGTSCTNTASVEVVVNPLPIIIAGANSPVCEGETINLTETGNKATTWNWTGPNSFTSTDQNPTITVASLAAAGKYYVTGTDDNGCMRLDSVEVVVQDTPDITATPNSPDCVNGDNGSIDFSIVGGTAPFNYNWNDGNNTGAGVGNEITGLPAGTYDVTITDANTCTVTLNSVIVDPSLFTVSGVGINPSESGLSDGRIDLNIQNGTANYTVSWNGPIIGSDTATAAGAFSIENLRRGNYTIIITDVNGCTTTTTVTVPESDCTTEKVLISGSKS